MLNRTKLKKQIQRRRLEKLAIIADKLDDAHAADKQDAMLAGLDDGWEGIRQAIIRIAGDRGEWAGYPLPVEHVRLTVEPRHPLADTLEGATFCKDESAAGGDYPDVINHWTDYQRGREIYVVRENGKSRAAVIPFHASTHRGRMILDTLAASQAWSVRAEFTAMARLKTLVTAAAFRYYLLTGTFIESSKRSGVFYLFRKARPTIAFKANADGDDTSLLCALCMHPIGYYQRTYAGSMVPTDDVIAHLLLMRADERKFWAKCNQHDCQAAEAGL